MPNRRGCVASVWLCSTDNAFVELLTGFGLATAAGLNAYIPLLALGLLSRFTDLVTLPHGWAWLENGWVMTIVAVLLVDGASLCQGLRLPVVGWRLAGPVSDLSEVLVMGCEPAALDVRVAPVCPAGPAPIEVVASRRSCR
jgi:Domain of unknown function (DUF4126)